jgi:hypothetical protein
MVLPGDNVREGVRTTAEEKSLIYKELTKWRLSHWREKWRSQWPSYGPKSLVSDADLENVAKHVGSITSIDHLRPLTHIIHWSQLSEPLFRTVRSALALATGVTPLIDQMVEQPVEHQELHNQNSDVGESAASVDGNRTNAQQARVGKLQQFENVILF